MKFPMNQNMLSRARKLLSGRKKLFWIVGGAGSGKSTICRILSKRFQIPIYDMDAHIYGVYHKRFTKDNHPTNYTWAKSQNSLEWLLQMSWDEFNSFNQSALIEYLDLLTEDLQSGSIPSRLLIDGGISNPGLLARAFPANQIVCLSRLHHSSKEIWESEERLSMKKLIDKLDKPKEAWKKFLEFDTKITSNILDECSASKIMICTRAPNETPTKLAVRIAAALNLHGSK